MEPFEKRIQLNNNRILIYRVSKGYIKQTYTIEEGFIDNKEVIKTYTLSQWDDYGLNGWIYNEKEINNISFNFDENHPLYFPLFHLLNYDDELLIEDDDTRENNKKYIRLYSKKEIIHLDFINELKEENSIGRFNVFIKNIAPDGRSKIDQERKDTKKRLFEFFNEVHNTLLNENRQISMEEYLLKNMKKEETKQLKKTFKRKIQ